MKEIALVVLLMGVMLVTDARVYKEYGNNVEESSCTDEFAGFILQILSKNLINLYQKVIEQVTEKNPNSVLATIARIKALEPEYNTVLVDYDKCRKSSKIEEPTTFAQLMKNLEKGKNNFKAFRNVMIDLIRQ